MCYKRYLLVIIYLYFYPSFIYWASQVALVVKNLSANAGDMRDVGWIPEVG